MEDPIGHWTGNRLSLCLLRDLQNVSSTCRFSCPTCCLFQVGNHIDVQSQKWVAQDAGIGAGVDSYFEYLVKGAVLLQDQELLHMFLGRPPPESGSVRRFCLTLARPVSQSTTGPSRTTPALTTGTCGSRCTKEPCLCPCSSPWRPSGPACR